MGKVSTDSRFSPSSPRYSLFFGSSSQDTFGAKRTHFGPNRHRFGATWVQTRPKSNPNGTQVDFAFPPSLRQQRQYLDLWTECIKAIHDAILPVRITKKNKEPMKQAKDHMELVVCQEHTF